MHSQQHIKIGASSWFYYRSKLISKFSTHLCLIYKCSLPVTLQFSIMHVFCPVLYYISCSHISELDTPNNIWGKAQAMRQKICNFHHGLDSCCGLLGFDTILSVWIF